MVFGKEHRGIVDKMSDKMKWIVCIMLLVGINLLYCLHFIPGIQIVLAMEVGPQHTGQFIHRMTRNSCPSIFITNLLEMALGQENVHFGNPTCLHYWVSFRKYILYHKYYIEFQEYVEEKNWY